MTQPAAIGHPGLVAAIAEDIHASGPITFARFIELALYHPQFGYYTRTTDRNSDERIDSDQSSENRAGLGRTREDRIGPGRACEDRIGWNGDFYTSSDVHPVMAQALARQVQQVDEALGRPDPVTVLEMGAGKGLLARDFLTACERTPGDFFRRLRYVIIERSPAMRASQRQQLTRWLNAPATVSWLDDLAQLETGSLVGIVLSNELVDAFPVHRITVEQGRPKELFVGWEQGRFVEQAQPLANQDLQRYLQRLSSIDITLAEGYRTEVNLAAVAWMKDVARVLGRGLVLTIDYGHTAQDLYGPDRRKGTLLCYYHQMASDDPYTRVGLQDMTAHVDFTSLATAGEEAGLATTGFTNQMSFLMGLGVEQILDGLEPGSRDFQAIVHLLRPEGMGRTFKILAQHKGVALPELDGLRFKPFFGSALRMPAYAK
ncbi:MAG: SAM-dependent methyltransferase [Nitrospirae bacterium]|nr:MAG: SAM-dependent methyltransferase [Nitrospirota bacterium]